MGRLISRCVAFLMSFMPEEGIISKLVQQYIPQGNESVVPFIAHFWEVSELRHSPQQTSVTLVDAELIGLSR